MSIFESMPLRAVTFTLIQPRDSACLAIAVSRTVLPDPLEPMKMLALLGSPGLLSRPDRISLMSCCRPASSGGTLPNVGVKGLSVIEISLSFP